MEGLTDRDPLFPLLSCSRWARRALKRGQMNMDEGTKEAIAEQLRIGTELRRKAERMGGRKGLRDSDDDDDDEDSTDASDSGEEDVGEMEGGGEGEGGSYGGARSTAKAKAAALEILEAAGAPADGEVATKVRIGPLQLVHCGACCAAAAGSCFRVVFPLQALTKPSCQSPIP